MNLFKFKNQDRDPDLEDEDHVEGEREFTSVNKGVALQNRITNWSIICGACALVVVLLYKYYASMYHNYKEAEVPLKDGSRTVATATLPPLVMPDQEPASLKATSDTSSTLPPLAPPAGPASGGTSTAGAPSTVKNLADLIRERRLKRELSFKLDTGAVSAGAVVGGAAADADAAGIAAPTGNAVRAEIGPATQHSAFAASRAYFLPDATLMITRGRAIPCTMVPAIDTTLTGIVTCVTSEDVTGANNKVSLMDRGTSCVGQQGGGVIQGQRRVGIVWQLCETPQHVLVPLSAGAADSLGRPGIPGAVDNHFWDRFGAAIALSLITDIGPYLIASRQGGSNNTTISFPKITGPQEVMSEVLKSTVNIPPTITAPQGAQVLIYLAGDIDFRDVYQLERMK